MSETERAMIVFDRVAKRYPNGREALAGVTFRIEARARWCSSPAAPAPARARY